MITLTTLRGDRFALNPDLIEEVKANGTSSVLTMVTGRSYTAAESISQVQQVLLDYRVSLLHQAQCEDHDHGHGQPSTTHRPGHLSPVPDKES